MASQTGSTSSHGRVREFFTPGRIVILVITAITLVFIFQNTGQTDIRLLFVEVSMPLWVTLFGTLLIGAICGFFFARRGRRR